MKPTIESVGPDVICPVVGSNVTLQFVITRESPAVKTSDIEWYYTEGDNTSSLLQLNTWSENADFMSRLAFNYSDLLSLSITGMEVQDAGTYTILANSPAGPQVASITLTVDGTCKHDILLLLNLECYL